jgi:hypothetical protein
MRAFRYCILMLSALAALSSCGSRVESSLSNAPSDASTPASSIPVAAVVRNLFFEDYRSVQFEFTVTRSDPALGEFYSPVFLQCGRNLLSLKSDSQKYDSPKPTRRRSAETPFVDLKACGSNIELKIRVTDLLEQDSVSAAPLPTPSKYGWVSLPLNERQHNPVVKFGRTFLLVDEREYQRPLALQLEGMPYGGPRSFLRFMCGPTARVTKISEAVEPQNHPVFSSFSARTLSDEVAILQHPDKDSNRENGDGLPIELRTKVVVFPVRVDDYTDCEIAGELIVVSDSDNPTRMTSSIDLEPNKVQFGLLNDTSRNVETLIIRVRWP